MAAAAVGDVRRGRGRGGGIGGPMDFSTDREVAAAAVGAVFRGRGGAGGVKDTVTYEFGIVRGVTGQVDRLPGTRPRGAGATTRLQCGECDGGWRWGGSGGGG